MKKKQGFTLVELMIVMILLGILMLGGWVGYGQMRQNALKSTYCSNIRTIETALQAYLGDNSIYEITASAMNNAITNVLAPQSNYVSDTVKKNVYDAKLPLVAKSPVTVLAKGNTPTTTYDANMSPGQFRVVVYTDQNDFYTQFKMVTNPQCAKE